MSQQNTITMTANWKKDLELEDFEICHGIRKNAWFVEMLKNWKEKC